MECIVFDIETAPDMRFWGDPEWCSKYREQFSAPSNWKDPVKIAGYVDDAFEKAKEKAALDMRYGRVRAIGWSPLDSDDEPDAVAGDDECEVIRHFVEALDQVREQPCVGGFWVRDFDIPFLTLRAAVHDVALPTWWPYRRNWNQIVDPVDVFGKDAGGLDGFAEALGLPQKLADGADAPDMPLDELLAYVRRDVEIERAFIRRIRQHFPGLSGRLRSIT